MFPNAAHYADYIGPRQNISRWKAIILKADGVSRKMMVGLRIDKELNGKDMRLCWVLLSSGNLWK